MWIIDSLLICNFFSLERCRRTSLFFLKPDTKRPNRTPTPSCIAWLRHRPDPSETLQKRHARAFAGLPQSPAAGLFREPVSADRKLAGGARDVWRPPLACTDPAADDDC